MSAEEQPTAETPSESILLSWDTRIRLLANAHVWRDALVAFGIGSVFVTILFLVISKSASALALGAGLFAFIMLQKHTNVPFV